MCDAVVACLCSLGCRCLPAAAAEVHPASRNMQRAAAPVQPAANHLRIYRPMSPRCTGVLWTV